MFDRDDNIYDNGSLFAATMHTGMFVGAGFAAFKLMKDPQATKEFAFKILDKVAPKTEPVYSSYEASLSAFRQNASSVGRIRREREVLSSALKNNSISKTLSNEKPLSINVGASSIDVGRITDKSFSYSSFEEIEDITGKKIGPEIKNRLQTLSNNMGTDRLLLDEAQWTGTSVKIKTANGKDIFIDFARMSNDGAMLVKNGNAFWSAPMFSHFELNAANKEIDGLRLVDWNTHILNMLGKEGALDNTAASMLNSQDLISTLENGNVLDLQKRLSRQYAEKEALDAVRAESLFSRLKLAVTGMKEELQYVNPLNKVQQTINAGLVVPDRGNVYDIAIKNGMSGFGSTQLELKHMKSIYGKDGRATADSIRKTIFGATSVPVSKIRLNNSEMNLAQEANKGISVASRLLNDINMHGGINGLVSQSQVAMGTRNIGGTLYGPPTAEGYKSVSSNSYKVSSRMNERYSGYKYNYRYGVNSGGTHTGELSNVLNRSKTAITTTGVIDFLGDEGIFINSQKSKLFMHDTYIQAGIDSFTDTIGNQNLNIFNSEGKRVDGYKLSDLYNLDNDSELYKLMSSGGHEIRFGKSSVIGVRSDARPITGVNDEFGIDVIDKYASLKGDAVMGLDEFNAFIGMNAGREGRISIPLRMRSQTTKGAIAGTMQRSSVSYVGFGTRVGKKVYAPENLSSSVDKLVYGYGRAFGNRNIKHLESAIGADLFKGVFPKEVLSGDILQTGKQQQEMVQTLHSLLLGEVDLAYKSNNTKFTLTGDKASVFNKFLLNKQSGPEISLTNLLYSGNARFEIPGTDQNMYKEQLQNLIDIYQEVRYRNATQSGGELIGDISYAPQNYLTDAWASSKDFWSQVRDTGRYNGELFTSLSKDDIRQHIWAAAPQISAMENAALSQGAKGFNTAKFAMRDQFMSLGTSRVKIMKELVSRNEVDTKLLMMEQELMRASVANPKAMPNLVSKYQQYVREVYGNDIADKYISQQKIQGTTTEAINAMKKDASDFFGAGGVNINSLREHPSLAADTFLSHDKNMVGKIFVTESGGLVHIPSANALGGLTILPDGRVTFEGKNAANVPKFYQLMENARSGGFITNRALDKASSSMYRLSDMIVKDRAKIQIHAASYARNVYDRSIAQHDVMNLIDDRVGALANIANESRSAIGHVASISEHDAKLLIQDEILKTIENIKHKQIGGSNAVVQSLNEMRAEWIHKDHGGIIEDLQKKLFNKEGNLIASDEAIFRQVKRTSNRIVGDRLKNTAKLKSELDRLYGMAQNSHKYSADQIATQISNITSHIEKTSLKMFGMRDPDIYASSESALYGFINREISTAGKEEMSKVMSVAFAAARNMAGDFDGDKLKYLLLHHGESHEAVKSSISGIQMKSELTLKTAKDRIKLLTGRPDGKKQIFNLSEEQLQKTVSQIFSQDKASMAAAFMTKAYTGSLNIGALGIKGELHKQLLDKKLTTSELEDALSFVNSIPSLFTEQQAISSKHLSSYIGKNIQDSTTPIETMISSIGKLDESQIMNIIKDTGAVHPSVLTHLSEVTSNPAQKAAYSNALDLADVILGYQSGYSKVSQQQLEKHKAFLQGERSETEWQKFVTDILESQNGRVAINETEWAKKINMPSSVMEVFSKMHEANSNNLNKIIKGMDEFMNNQGEKLGDKQLSEVFSTIEELRQRAFHISEDIYGAESSILPRAVRRPVGWHTLTEKTDPIVNWIKEAPKERLGGLALLAMATTAVLNLTTGSTIDSKDDVPSMNNPGMEASSRYHGSQGIFSGSNVQNRSYGLLTSGNLSNRHSVSSVNSIIGNSGYHSVSLRNDGTNPYLDKMSYYN